MKWELLWTALGITLTSTAFGAYFWMHIVDGAVPSWPRLAAFLLLPPLLMTASFASGLALHFHGLAPTNGYYEMFQLTVYIAAGFCSLAWTFAALPFLRAVSKAPLPRCFWAYCMQSLRKPLQAQLCWCWYRCTLCLGMGFESYCAL